jgi:DNA repair protein RecN (Recombination protein N)
VLQSLHIRNLALLERVELDFEPGFTAVTGETGAGKSILLGALSLLAGERADKSIVRQGAAACEVEAALAFADSRSIDAILSELGLPECEEGLLVLKRTVAADKAPRITVNGSLATLGALQRLGAHWIDFHGPSEPRRLLKESCQLELLDLFGGLEEAANEYRRAYRAWRAAVAERQRLADESEMGADQLDFLRQQLERFQGTDLADEAIEALERDFHRMSRSQELIEIASALAAGLAGDEGLQCRLAPILREARRLAEIDPASGALAERVAAAAVELADLAAEYSALAQDLQVDAEAAQAIAERMNAWLELKRRYGPSPADARSAHAEMARRVELHSDLSGALADLDNRIDQARQEALDLAATLRGRREKAALSLSRAAAKEIAQLGFVKSEFTVRLTPKGELTPEGDGSCEFLFSPNVGEEPKPLSRIASSGELARVMLALKSVLADLDEVPVLVFDEVDANVGGEIGRSVGEKMAAIGRKHQVLCVTHLPQVAAQAASHLVVIKDQSKARAEVRIAGIAGDRKARVSELARMLGDRGSKSALAHAEKLLQA